MDVAAREQLLAAGLANQRRGELAGAERCYRLVLTQQPQDFDALYRMGVLALQCGNAQGAVHYLARAQDVRPLDADGFYNLGMAHALHYSFDRAQAAFERSRALDANHPSAAVSLGNVHKLMGRASEAREAYMAAIASPRIDPVLFSQVLVGLHSNPTVDAQTLYALHREWARRYAQPLLARAPVHSNARDMDRRLAIGFVSPRFCSNIVGHFLRSLLRPLAAEADVFLYHAGAQTDWLTEELAHCNVRWRDIATLDDDAAARLVQRDRIDVLVDLAGHAPRNRLLLFARRPAPVQATWLDYFNTTGLDTIDVIVTDRVSTPPALVASGAQRFAEAVEYMPHSRLCYAAPPFAPAVSAPAALREGRVTFGCFGRVDKIGAEVIAVWAAILSNVAGSRLIVKSEGLEVPAVRDRLLQQFGAYAIAAERILLRGRSTHEALLAEYADVDIALDPFPYNGGATTC
ncbi:MAG TPA: hypothetical protein VFC24_02780, partial [Casimicrobiaceae bacterium]|nr:hypothetical protein [Casimicrobiaceae bacterium]